ncbi:hypothetical protein LAZ67_1007149 [Cordylochernes scorpioides]|uniref:HTH CENPB-type domain-containing protein n=1 Tax=Cordylochernes scorpioides TaxID=51811 RepID=A0ABY6K408_9ARAC|nr:hypothetical protein LAZ67_1007149 [Cordylochernes scorpioides]
MASTSERNQSESDMDCDEIICDLSDTSDTEIYSYHDTDSEQNSEADEELPNDDSEFYFGKDGVTKWKKTMWQKTQIRTRSTNIISQLPGPKSEAKSIESESDAFTKIIDIDMVQKIVDCTNAYISNIKEHFSRERDAKLTTVTEILALFGLLIMSGVKRAAHLTYKELWAVDGSGVEIVRAIMSQDRFLFLLRCLRFDDITTRKERKKLDKLAPIREFVEAFVYNCKKLYTPGEYNTIDEKLIPFRGRCGFRQYMPNKPAKYGLKIYTISDARTFYTFNFEIYCGKQPDGPYKKSNSPDDIVKRLITPISGTSRNITTDNWYTSYKLSQDLLTEHKLTLVGTLKKNKKEIPKIFLPNRNRPKYNSIFGFTQNTTLVSYVPKKSKAVLLLSTMHSTPTIDEESGFKLKPEIVTFYNLTKGGVDMVNQMCGTYSVGRRTNRWPLCLFFDLLNVAGINSEIIFKSLNINSPRVPRRIFLKNISLQLFQDHLKIRSQLKNLPRSLHDLIILHCKKAESPEKKTEKALVIWIEDLTQKRITLDGHLIKMKALKFYKELKESEPSTSSRESNPQFSASIGWLTGFIKIHSFHNLKIKGEVASADEEAARKYPEKLAKIIKDGYCAHQIFNADETGLFWKKMPTRTYIAKSEKNASGFKAAKDRVTLLLCSNASGDRMLKPLLVNRSLKPRALKGKDLNTLPVHWMANKKAWVTTAIFTEWFNKCFVPEVENYMKEMGLEFKILLILDNAPGHPNLEHPNIKVVFSPPNTTSLIQPLDQGIISTFKKYYVKFTFQFIFDKLESDTITVTEVWKQFNILNCVDHVALAIAEIKSQTLNACWKAAWPECVSKRNESNRTTIVTSDIISIAKEIGGEGFDDFGEHDIEELLVDEALNDDDILESMVGTTKDFETVDSELEDVTPLDEKLLREGLQLSGDLVAIWTPIRKIRKCEKLLSHFEPCTISEVNYLVTPKDEPNIDPHVIHISGMKLYFQRIQKDHEDVVEPEGWDNVRAFSISTVPPAGILNLITAHVAVLNLIITNDNAYSDVTEIALYNMIY